jgi:hypothetical protein
VAFPSQPGRKFSWAQADRFALNCILNKRCFPSEARDVFCVARLPPPFVSRPQVSINPIIPETRTPFGTSTVPLRRWNAGSRIHNSAASPFLSTDTLWAVATVSMDGVSAAAVFHRPRSLSQLSTGFMVILIRKRPCQKGASSSLLAATLTPSSHRNWILRVTHYVPTGPLPAMRKERVRAGHIFFRLHRINFKLCLISLIGYRQ